MEIEYIMALIALAAVVVGPAIQLQIAKRQIRAQLVSANRQKWIEELRSDIADFIARLAILSATISTKTKSIDADKLDQLMHTSHRIMLRLNHNEPEHQKLVKLLNSLVELCRESLQARTAGKQIDEGELGDLLDRVVSVSTCARAIFKTEWERIKRGE